MTMNKERQKNEKETQRRVEEKVRHGEFCWGRGRLRVRAAEVSD